MPLKRLKIYLIPLVDIVSRPVEIVDVESGLTRF